LNGTKGKEILRVEGLCKEFLVERSFFKKISDAIFGRKSLAIKALDGVSFSVFEKETVGILGESGSGKSTLARVLMGLYKSDSGKASLMGKDLLNPGRADRLENLRKMQMVFQDPFSSLNPRMNVREILSEPLIIHGKLPTSSLEEKLSNALKEVGLEPEALSLYPNEFSGGQRQRIGICRALILDPILLIADEAVSALDVSVQAQILELLMSLKEKRNFSLLFISHDVAVVRQIADRIIVLHRGKILEMLPVECLLKDAFHPYTKKLLSAALHLREGFPPDESFSAMVDTAHGCNFKAYCGEKEISCDSSPMLSELHPEHWVACWRVAQAKNR
jgi:oligopeptide/dipeptide ABC transporter ATP-binding protein